MTLLNRLSKRSADLGGLGLSRAVPLIMTAVAVTALISYFGIARDYAHLNATLFTGGPGGRYYMLGASLAARAGRGHGTVTVVPTAGSIENIRRLTDKRTRCVPAFALMQDGTPVPEDAEVEVLGRLPDAETLLLLGKRGRSFSTFADLRGASIGIGPEGSGTAFLMRQLFEDPDLVHLGIRLSTHSLAEQAALVADGRLDLAAMVSTEEAKPVHDAIADHDLDVASPREIEGLVKRHPWLDLGHVPAGRYDLEKPVPPVDRQVARVDTLVVTGPCARRSERVALLTLLSAELPGFVRSNPPKPTGSTTELPLAPEARQFFLTGEPQLADRYFPWLVNLMSPVYWVYLVMAFTLLANAKRSVSRFRLSRIDHAREKLKARIDQLASAAAVGGKAPVATAGKAVSDANAGTAEGIMEQLAALRARCHRYTRSIFMPMGDELYYRYQESMIEDSMERLAALQRSPGGGGILGRAAAGLS